MIKPCFEAGTPGFEAPSALYVHVPVCASKCSYCDFFSLPASSLPEGFETELVEATLDRASRLAERFGSASFDTLYVGGGTPTMLPPAAMDRLLSGLSSLAGGRLREWTVEANPDSLGPAILEVFVRRGVTRLSLGVQSLDAEELRLLGRRHGPEAALESLHLAAEGGLALSADLIAGVPRRDVGCGGASGLRRGGEKLARYARELFDAGVRHLSVYDLTLEEGTPLAESRAALAFPSEDEAYDSRLLLENALSSLGMRRYEVSNYSVPGAECLHNLKYWRMDSYIGAGPGAVSTIATAGGGSLRIEEARTLSGYRDAASRASESMIAPVDAAFETMMMAFRCVFGLDLDSFERRFGLPAEALVGRTLAAWAEHVIPGASLGGIEQQEAADIRRSIALDGRGLDILDRFLVSCLEEIEENRYLFR
jgi:oxygen-independent coproporphyrinogen III oxidase